MLSPFATCMFYLQPISMPGFISQLKPGFSPLSLSLYVSLSLVVANRKISSREVFFESWKMYPLCQKKNRRPTVVLLLLYCSRVGSLNENTAQNQFKYVVCTKNQRQSWENIQMIINEWGTFWERMRTSVLLCVGSIGYYNEVDHLQGSPTVIALGHSEHCIIGDSISSLPTRPEN